jgi:citrate synthase
MTNDKKPSGLEDVVVCEQDICFIDGKRGQLVYHGYDIDDLSENSTFEEVAYLLWNGKLPNAVELKELQRALSQAMSLPEAIYDLLRVLPKNTDAMRALATGVSALGAFDAQADDNSPAANCAKAIRLTAQLPLLTTAWHHSNQGQKPIPPDRTKSIAYNFLKTLEGKEPDEYTIRTFDVALILHADHELNASTFSGRVTAATLSDMHSAVVAAINTLKGPLHGGANEAVMTMLRAIGEVDKAEAYVQNMIANKQKVMGFGHRVYKAKDPRAVILEEMSEELARLSGDSKWLEMSRIVERTFQPTVAAKGVYPNVDFYSASTYHMMGIPDDLFTPIFACSRVAGWTAHIMQQYANNRIFRPSSDYVGPQNLKWVPVEKRD